MKYFFSSVLLMAMMQIARAQSARSSKTTTVVDLKAKMELTDSQKQKMAAIFKWRQVKLDSLKNILYIADQRELVGMEKIEYAHLLSQNKSFLSEKQKEKFINLYGAKSVFSNLDKTPNIFPFPPPKGYTIYTFPDRFLKKHNSLQDVNLEIIKALTPAGYTDLSYYSIPGGIAIVTKIERINPDGVSFSTPDRFNLNCVNHMHITGTLSSGSGYFRVFAFVITNVPFSGTDDHARTSIAKNWIGDGMSELPAVVGEVKLTAGYHCCVLMYEFETDGTNNRVMPVRPAKLSAWEHLKKSAIGQYLVH